MQSEFQPHPYFSLARGLVRGFVKVLDRQQGRNRSHSWARNIVVLLIFCTMNGLKQLSLDGVGSSCVAFGDKSFTDRFLPLVDITDFGITGSFLDFATRSKFKFKPILIASVNKFDQF